MKTLFQSWCENNDKKPLPQQYQQQENPYLQTLKLAEVRSATFQQRQARRVRTWFENHPECKGELLPLDWRDQQLRSEETAIDTESRSGNGWFDKTTGFRVVVDSVSLEIHEVDLPEHRLSEVDSLDKPLAIAAAMNTEAYRREILLNKSKEEFKKGQRKLSNEKIIEMLRRKERGEMADVLAVKYGISKRTFYNYRSAYSDAISSENLLSS